MTQISQSVQSIVRNLCLILFIFQAGLSMSQNQLRGVVTDLITGNPIEGALIVNFTTGAQAVSDSKGNFVILIKNDSSHLRVKADRYFDEQRFVLLSDSSMNIGMLLDIENLREVVLVGSRFKPRSIANSPVPIDNISNDNLRSAGHYDLDMMLMYNVPSFNSSNQTISDATAHMNPADLRGLGPSRTLVLVNGKRKNASALVYINDTPGKGEVGVDLKSIPIAAIERIEILRDGASAQYGSDAIAGVINVILKNNTEYAEVNTSYGITEEGDGATLTVDGNFGFKISSKGFINVSTSISDQQYTNRPGDWRKDDEAFLIVPITDTELSEFPHAGSKVGQPDMVTNSIFYNASIPISSTGELYSFGGLTSRTGTSFALHRTPSFAAIVYGYNPSIFGASSFHPTFETDITDNTLAFGVKGTKNDWNFDLSLTLGSNEIDYNIGRTINASIGISTPTEFYAGGYQFSQFTNNFDVSKNFEDFGLAFGVEYRSENFIATAGEEDSYLGSGAVSFPGIQPANEVDKKRFNFSYYTNIESDLTNALFIDLAARYENYSDFGDNLSGKISARLKIIDQLNIRGSISSGFRAPSLHQIYLSNIQTLASGNTISEQGTFNNQSPIIRAFNVPALKQETSLNISGGISYQPSNNLHLTADFYHIEVDDRIVFTGAISNTDSTTAIGSVLNQFAITSFKFFINGIDTKTEGLDLVASYYDVRLGKGFINTSLAVNYNTTQIVGDLKTPSLLSSEGNTLFDRKERSRIESSRPKSKIILGLNYKIKELGITLNNTRFGEVTWHNSNAPGGTFNSNYGNFSAGDTVPDWDQTFSAKILTDLTLSYELSKMITFSSGVNNLLNIYPDEVEPRGDFVTDLAGRFKYPWEVNQFGFNGRYYFFKLRVKL